jgi:tRNA threonylcarbamoyladenosine biosynthesis protein TsaE
VTGPLPDASLDLPDRRATKCLARALGGEIAPGDAVILRGPLGAGKTFFVRAVCRALGLPEAVPVQSPTFTLVRELPTRPPIAHADLYRLGSFEEAEQLGLPELRDRGYVLLVEWGERYADALGPDRLEIALTLGPRRAMLRANGPRSERLGAGILHAARALIAHRTLVPVKC